MCIDADKRSICAAAVKKFPISMKSLTDGGDAFIRAFQKRDNGILNIQTYDRPYKNKEGPFIKKYIHMMSVLLAILPLLGGCAKDDDAAPPGMYVCMSYGSVLELAADGRYIFYPNALQSADVTSGSYRLADNTLELTEDSGARFFLSVKGETLALTGGDWYGTTRQGAVFVPYDPDTPATDVR